jgi:hypothetical protein
MTFSTALDHFKTQRALALALGIKEQAIGYWKRTGKVPMGRAYQLEKLTGGAIKVDPSCYGTESKRNGAGA